MKALKITLSHGRIWTAETSSGVRTQSSTLEGALDQLIPAGDPARGFLDTYRRDDPEKYNLLHDVLAAIPDSGGDGNIARGQASG